jgi:hypothetical protein
MGTAPERVQVEEADPGPGHVVPAAERPAARRAVLASVEPSHVRAWHFNVDAVPSAGFLAVEGCIARETVTTTLHRLIEAGLLGHESSVCAGTLVPFRD